MVNSEVEKELKEIRKDVETLSKKIDLVIDKSKDKDPDIREAFKDSYQLFVAVILGAFSGALVGVYVEHPSFWLIGAIVVFISVLSLFFGFYPYVFRKRMRKEK